MVEIINLTKNYPNQTVLNNFSHTFNKGINGLIGKNGAGKTTLFNCIYGTEKYAGAINQSKSITYLPAELYFYPRTRGVEFIEFLCATKKQKLDYQKMKTLNEFMNLPLSKYACQYSTGMKKKLGLLAMHLIKGDTLLLDEPFNGLDIEGQAVCTELMRLLEQNHKTIIISSHITSQLTTTCKKIHFLNKGRITQSFVKSEFSKIDIMVNDSFKQIIQSVQETFEI